MSYITYMYIYILVTPQTLCGVPALRTYVHRKISDICSQTCQSAILLHASMTNMANISRTWFRTLRTYVHSNICSQTCQTMHFVHEFGMTREGDHDFELVATPIHTHTPLPLRQHKHKLQTCSAAPQRQHSIPCTILLGPMAATSDHEIAALPKNH